jgi:hypothetical protein
MTQDEWNAGMGAINQQARDVETHLRALRDSWAKRLQRIVDGRPAKAADEAAQFQAEADAFNLVSANLTTAMAQFVAAATPLAPITDAVTGRAAGAPAT